MMTRRQSTSRILLNRWRLEWIVACLCVTLAVKGASVSEESLLSIALGSGAPEHADEDKHIALQEVFGDDTDHGQAEDSIDKSSMQLTAMFLDLDQNKDGFLSQEEFKLHYHDILSGQPTIPSALPIGKPSDDDVLLAWREFDTDNDGKVTATEWGAIMFHEDPQIAQFYDGVEAKGDSDELTHRKILFRDWDLDHSGGLSREEARGMLRGTVSESPTVMTLSDDEIDMVLYQLFDDHDKDNDNILTLTEFLDGEQY